MIDPEAEMAALRALGGSGRRACSRDRLRRRQLTLRYAPATCSVLAIDPCADAIVKARDALPVESAERVRFEIASALELDQPLASFDVALLPHSL